MDCSEAVKMCQQSKDLEDQFSDSMTLKLIVIWNEQKLEGREVVEDFCIAENSKALLWSPGLVSYKQWRNSRPNPWQTILVTLSITCDVSVLWVSVDSNVSWTITTLVYQISLKISNVCIFHEIPNQTVKVSLACRSKNDPKIGRNFL